MAQAVRLGPGRGTMFLSDISGYTAFLRAVAQAHAAEMAAGTFVPKAYPLLASLLDGIIERVAPPFTISKLEGDAPSSASLPKTNCDSVVSPFWTVWPPAMTLIGLV